MKKRYAVVLASLLLCNVFAGCTQPSENSSAAAPSDSASAENETTEIRVMLHEMSKEKIHTQIAENFMKENPNIKVKIEYPAANDLNAYGDKINTMILAGEKIDIATNTYFVGYHNLASEGMYYGLNQFFEREGTSYEDEYNINIAIDGEVYGIPWATKTYLTFLNKDMLEEAGLEVPDFDWTWDDYREYAKQLTKGEGTEKTYGSFMYTWTHYYGFGLFAGKTDTPFFDETGALVWDDNNFLQLRWDMEHEDLSQMPYAEVVSSGLTQQTAFFSEKAAMVINGTWMFPDIANTETYPHDFETAIAPLPRFADDEPGQVTMETRYFNIPNTSEHPYEAYQFARYYSTEGMKIDTSGFSAAKTGADMKTSVDMMLGGSAGELCDMDSFYNTMDEDKMTITSWVSCPPYTTEIDQLLCEVSSEFLAGGISIDETKEKYFAKGQEIIDRYAE